MGMTIATGVNTRRLTQNHGETISPTEGKRRVAVVRSLAWRRFLNDLTKAMLMTDPIAYGWYVAWGLEAEGQTESETMRRANRRQPAGLRPARRSG
jgi:hypothetical protein